MDTTLVTGLKNIDQPTVERYWNSVLSQIDRGPVIVVDYGSTPDNLKWERDIFAGDSVSFIEVSRDTDVWREGRVYNIGIKRANTKFVVSTPPDIVLGRNFMQIVDQSLSARDGRIVFCMRKDLDSSGNDMGYAPNCNYGACIGVSRLWMESVGGFDEEYRGWGEFDMDLAFRARDSGLEWKWIEGETEIVHPYHPFRNGGFIRENREYHDLHHELIRNPTGWGNL